MKMNFIVVRSERTLKKKILLLLLRIEHFEKSKKNIFQCRNEMKVIFYDKVCDGKINCFYGRDELNCHLKTSIALNSQFCKTQNVTRLICEKKETHNIFQLKLLKKSIIKKLEIFGEGIKLNCLLEEQESVTSLSIYHQNFQKY